MDRYSGYIHRRKNKRIQLSMMDRKGRRKVLDSKDAFLLKMAATGGDTFAEQRSNYIKTERRISVKSMMAIVDIFFKLVYGFPFTDVNALILKDGRAIRIRVLKEK